MRIKKFKTKVAKDISSTSKTNMVKATKIKKKDNSANLGRYLHPAKLPSGDKIGASTAVKMTKQRRLKMRAQKGAHLNV